MILLILLYLGVWGFLIYCAYFLFKWIIAPLFETTSASNQERITLSSPFENVSETKKFEFRPQKWEEFIGQEKAKERAKIIIQKAKMGIRSHTLIDGHPGCFIAGTKILMSDYTWKNIEKVKIGDTVLGFDENGTRRLRPSIVTNNIRRISQEIVHIKSNKNEVYTTPEHPFLIYTKNWINEWRNAENIKPNKHSCYSFSINYRTKTWEKGWIIGSIMSDGSLPENYKTVLYYNKNKTLINEFIRIMDKLHIHTHLLKRKNGTYQITCNKNFVRKKIEKQIYRFKHLQVSKDFLRGYIAGYYDGDGGSKAMYSTDLENLQLIQLILREQFGFDCSIQKRRISKKLIDNKYKSKKPYFRLNLNQLTLFYSIFQPYSKYDYNALNATSKQTINTVSYKAKPTVVYNLTTTTSTYIANGFPVHNCGKTTYVHLLAKYLEAEVIEYIGKQITEEEIPNIVNRINASEKRFIIFFCDEIDGLDTKVMKILNPMLEQFKLNEQKIHPFIFIGATINKHELIENNPDTLDRIPTHIKFKRYDNREIETIIKQYYKQLYFKFEINEDDIPKIAENAKFNPRTAISLLEDYIVLKNITQVLEARDIIKDGLTSIDIRILDELNNSKKADGEHKPLGANALALSCGLSPKEYVIQFEPFLQEFGYIKRVPSRTITEKGMDFLESIKEN